VELEPERLADRLCHVLDRADRHGGERERDARRLGRAARQDLAVAVLHAAEPDRRERERERGVLADDRGGEIAAGHVDQQPLAQLDALEVGAVGAQRLLRVGAGLRIIEKSARHLAAGLLSQVVDAGHGAHGEGLYLPRPKLETGNVTSALRVYSGNGGRRRPRARRWSKGIPADPPLGNKSEQEARRGQTEA